MIDCSCRCLSSLDTHGLKALFHKWIGFTCYRRSRLPEDVSSFPRNSCGLWLIIGLINPLTTWCSVTSIRRNLFKHISRLVRHNEGPSFKQSHTNCMDNFLCLRTPCGYRAVDLDLSSPRIVYSATIGSSVEHLMAAKADDVDRNNLQLFPFGYDYGWIDPKCNEIWGCLHFLQYIEYRAVVTSVLLVCKESILLSRMMKDG